MDGSSKLGISVPLKESFAGLRVNRLKGFLIFQGLYLSVTQKSVHGKQRINHRLMSMQGEEIIIANSWPVAGT